VHPRQEPSNGGPKQHYSEPKRVRPSNIHNTHNNNQARPFGTSTPSPSLLIVAYLAQHSGTFDDCTYRLQISPSKLDYQRA
jgi:hypothetical protein